MFDINNYLPMTGLELRTSGIGMTALPTEPQPLPSHLEPILMDT